MYTYGVLCTYVLCVTCVSLYLCYSQVGKYGAVSALDINLDGTRLLCGHAKGLVSE